MAGLLCVFNTNKIIKKQIQFFFTDHQMNRSDDDAEMKASGDLLERLREICNKSLPQHGNTMFDMASNETLQAYGSTLFHCHLCSFTSVDRDEYNEHTNDHYEFR